MIFDPSKLYAVIMAGGRGERFWPVGRACRPKQLLPLLGDRTMIEETVQRLFPLIAPEHLFVITNQAYVKQIQQLLPIPPENVIGEPVGRDTAPCIALATAFIRRQNADATMIVLPADHVIRPVKLFQETLRNAAEQAQTGALITLGITPTAPLTGYGYLHLGESAAPGYHQVLEFKEKPDLATAEEFLRNGNYRWNSGIFIWRADAISAAFAKYAPQLSAKLEAWTEGADFLADFTECEKISIDYAIMEKAENVLAGDVNFYWNDIGAWSALRSILPLDDYGNAIRGNVVTLDSSDNVLLNDGEELLSVIGIHDIAFIKSGNGILVCPLSEEQKIKKLLPEIGSKGSEYL